MTTTVLCVEIRAAEILNELGARQRIGVEIGVHTGQLSELLLRGDPGLWLYMVDPWRPMDSEAYRATDDHHHRMTQEQHDQCMASALKRANTFGGRGKLVRCTSLQAATAFSDATLDFVFIDGDHSYEGVKADIAAWWPKMVRGGIFSGHDYRTDKPGYGVIQAVDEFVAEQGLELRLGQNYCWFVTK